MNIQLYNTPAKVGSVFFSFCKYVHVMMYNDMTIIQWATSHFNFSSSTRNPERSI